MIWIQLSRPFDVQKGDVVRLRIDKIRQYQPGNYQWVVTPLGKEGNMIKLELTNPQQVQEGMFLKILDMKETAKSRWTCKAEIMGKLDPDTWDLIHRAIRAVNAFNA